MRAYLRTGRLKGVRIGKQYRISREDLDTLTGGSPSLRPEPVRRHRHVDVSTIVQVDVISPESVDRVTNMRNLVESANKMPEADYGFKPAPEIRSYRQLFGHVANSQFGACAAAKGEPNPNQGTNNEQKTMKAEFLKALNDSFAYCDPVYKALTDATAVEFVKRGQNEVARGVVLANNNAHNDEMYGISTVYLRLKGLVPPSTEAEEQRRQQQRR